MDKIEIVNLDTSSGSYINAFKQIEFAIASAAVRDIEVLKFSCENAICKSFKNNMRRAIRQMKKAGKINCFVYGENFKGDNDETRYLLEKAEYIKFIPPISSAIPFLIRFSKSLISGKSVSASFTHLTPIFYSIIQTSPGSKPLWFSLL